MYFHLPILNWTLFKVKIKKKKTCHLYVISFNQASLFKKGRLWYVMSLQATKNLNLELKIWKKISKVQHFSKIEKCWPGCPNSQIDIPKCSLAANCIQNWDQWVGHIFPPNFFLLAGFPPNFSSWQIILLGINTPRHYFSWDFILLDFLIILPIHFSPRQ